MNPYTQLPDHPEIANALLTGYPNPREVNARIECDRCGRKASGMNIDSGTAFCEECINELLLDMRLEQKLDALGLWGV